MSSQDEHCNPDHMTRPASSKPDPVSVIYFRGQPNDDLDMFSRWIKLSDEALAANRNATRKVWSCGPLSEQNTVDSYYLKMKLCRLSD